MSPAAERDWYSSVPKGFIVVSTLRGGLEQWRQEMRQGLFNLGSIALSVFTSSISVGRFYYGATKNT